MSTPNTIDDSDLCVYFEFSACEAQIVMCDLNQLEKVRTNRIVVTYEAVALFVALTIVNYNATICGCINYSKQQSLHATRTSVTCVNNEHITPMSE